MASIVGMRGGRWQASPTGGLFVTIAPNFLIDKETLMSIKSDKWIRRMAEQPGMIEPFETELIRHVNG